MKVEHQEKKVTFNTGKIVTLTSDEWNELAAHFTQQLMANVPWPRKLEDCIGKPIQKTQTPVQPTSPYNPWTVWY